MKKLCQIITFWKTFAGYAKIVCCAPLHTHMDGSNTVKSAKVFPAIQYALYLFHTLPSQQLLLLSLPRRTKGHLPGADCHHHKAGFEPGHPVLCLHLHQEVAAGWRQHQGHWECQDLPHWRRCRCCQCVWQHSSRCRQDTHAGSLLTHIL